jgi:hypothetical protein
MERRRQPCNSCCSCTCPKLFALSLTGSAKSRYRTAQGRKQEFTGALCRTACSHDAKNQTARESLGLSGSNAVRKPAGFLAPVISCKFVHGAHNY